MKYFICGFMGAGKSTLLGELSGKVKSEFELIDLDDLIFKEHGGQFKNLGMYIESIGLDHFRALEFSALMNLSLKDNVVVALGGGSLTEQSMALLVGWKGFWLNTDFETCWSRISEDTNRPLVKLGKSNLSELYTQRALVYSQYPAISTARQFIDKHTLL
jgi:shikimate kinase